MKLDPRSEEFYAKYGFKLSVQQKHPIYGDEMSFDGLEADYVTRIERELEHYKRCLGDSLANNQRLLTQEYYRLKDETKRLEAEKSE